MAVTMDFWVGAKGLTLFEKLRAKEVRVICSEQRRISSTQTVLTHFWTQALSHCGSGHSDATDHVDPAPMMPCLPELADVRERRLPLTFWLMFVS